MTVTDIRTKARRLARVSSSGASDSIVNSYIEDAYRQFCLDVGGLKKDAYPEIKARFDTRTHQALRVTVSGGSHDLVATDIPITANDRNDVPGGLVASDLQAKIIAAGASDVTVTWTNFYFTVKDTGGATVTIASPSDDEDYDDATDYLGLEDSGTTITGDYPQDCTVFIDLPEDSLRVESVEWDDNKLFPAPANLFMSPESTGDPYYYSVRGTSLILYPSPKVQKRLHIWYRAAPFLALKGYQECGFTDITDTTLTGLTASTQYYFKTTIDSGTISELNITTKASDLTYATVIAQMNTAVIADDNDCEFEIVDGDLRCTSKTDRSVSANSSVYLSAGTTGTDLFAALKDADGTSWSAFETAVPGTEYLDKEFQDEYHRALVYLVAYYLLEERFDTEEAMKNFSMYNRLKNQFKTQRANEITGEEQRNVSRWYTVDSSTL